MKAAVSSSTPTLSPGTRSHRCPKKPKQNISNHETSPIPWTQFGMGLLTATAVSFGSIVTPLDSLIVSPAFANLPTGVTVKSARALLRNALPINNKPIREIQRELELIDEFVRIPGNQGFGQVSRAAQKSLKIVSNSQSAILADVDSSKQQQATKDLQSLKNELPELIEIVKNRDKNEILYKQQDLLVYVSSVEEAMIKEFPFTVPKEYANLPQLKGRATLEMKVNFKEKFRGDGALMKIIVDGLNAPITAGSFVDLVQKKFYDNMEIQRADGFVVQTGRPEKGEFYIDPKTNEERKIPLEIRVDKDKEPIYEFTLEDLGRFNEQPALSFNAYGTMAMARSEFDNNSGSSQFFFLLKESELTPSGSNLLDGRYSVFGYVVDGQDALADMKVGDKIEYVKVISGGENLQVV
eukprot:g7175.t1